VLLPPVKMVSVLERALKDHLSISNNQIAAA